METITYNTQTLPPFLPPFSCYLHENGLVVKPHLYEFVYVRGLRLVEMPPMKTPAKKTLLKKKTDGNKEFVWSDDEAELLVNVANEYKIAKAAESVDWESVKSKYKDIFDHFVAALPEQNIDICRNFPHKIEQIKLQNVIYLKIKNNKA